MYGTAQDDYKVWFDKFIDSWVVEFRGKILKTCYLKCEALNWIAEHKA